MPRPKKIKYLYDPETCTYDRAAYSPRRIIYRFLSFSAVFAIGAAFVAFFFGKEVAEFKESLFLNELSSARTAMNQQNSDLDHLAETLNLLYQRDNKVYLPILNAMPIPKTVWDGGRGGSNKYNKGDSSLSYQTGTRIEDLFYRIELLNNNYDKCSDLREKLGVTMRTMPAISPIKGNFISGFGYRRSPISGRYQMHTGLDFAAPMGTPIYAAGDGKVIFAAYNAHGYGTSVDIDHGNGYESKYAHMMKLSVKEGDEVKRGQIIGYSGNSGMSTGPHLHYEIKHKGVKIDPLDYFYSDLSPTQFLKLRKQADDPDYHPMD